MRAPEEPDAKGRTLRSEEEPRENGSSSSIEARGSLLITTMPTWGAVPIKAWRDDSMLDDEEGHGGVVSLPRRAMIEMGRQVCCLMCDAPDAPNSSRCRECISAHRSLHERLEHLDRSDPLRQLAGELSTMLRNPERFDHDEEQREMLEHYQRLMGIHLGSRRPRTTEDVAEIFTRQREGKGYETAASDDDIIAVRAISRSITPSEAPDPRRSVPSRPTHQVDRSSRSGEDVELDARVGAQVRSATLPDELAESTEAAHAKAVTSKRKSISDVIDSIDDLFDD